MRLAIDAKTTPMPMKMKPSVKPATRPAGLSRRIRRRHRRHREVERVDPRPRLGARRAPRPSARPTRTSPPRAPRSPPPPRPSAPRASRIRDAEDHVDDEEGEGHQRVEGDGLAVGEHGGGGGPGRVRAGRLRNLLERPRSVPVVPVAHTRVEARDRPTISMPRIRRRMPGPERTTRAALPPPRWMHVDAAWPVERLARLAARSWSSIPPRRAALRMNEIVFAGCFSEDDRARRVRR